MLAHYAYVREGRWLAFRTRQFGRDSEGLLTHSPLSEGLLTHSPLPENPTLEQSIPLRRCQWGQADDERHPTDRRSSDRSARPPEASPATAGQDGTIVGPSSSL